MTLLRPGPRGYPIAAGLSLAEESILSEKGEEMEKKKR